MGDLIKIALVLAVLGFLGKEFLTRTVKKHMSEDPNTFYVEQTVYSNQGVDSVKTVGIHMANGWRTKEIYVSADPLDQRLYRKAEAEAFLETFKEIFYEKQEQEKQEQAPKGPTKLEL